ncbi:hypothetical protein SAMN05443665_101456 [Actinomadura meyerae]|jgi:hypothetical protein|uniref:Uncharacterized protein n=1 Tax=Actinomadura meyerae TaxID=240840 RepID=A0A239J6Z4_9ACTN|nr:hypothetical protein SAMN05443665_101456 [Actinomadura meyerae]
MTPRHFVVAPRAALPAAPALPRRGRPGDVRPYDLSHIIWAHAFPDS